MLHKLLLTILSGMTLLHGADLTIAAKGKSDYQIVLPDRAASEPLGTFLTAAANQVRNSIRRCTGANLPVVKESAMAPGKPAIFVGQVEALKKLNLDPAKFQLWEHRIVADGKNLFLVGQDVPANPKAPWPRSPGSHILGSVKAALAFNEKFAGTQYLFPGEPGISVLPQEEIRVPERFSYAKIPAVQYVIGRGTTLEYDLANNRFYTPWYGSYGGHSHNVAIPPQQYFKTNPEYFALINGKRTTHSSHPQYCLSNPKVQEMIYRELLNHLDQGYQMVQLGASDGFRPCECENCKKLYDTTSYGEKLWMMHRAMAEKLLKDRPGKLVCIMAYGPTRTPPQSFKEFPDNVMIELAPYNDRILQAWQPYRVKQGYVVYLYNWGWYQAEGLTPKITWKFCAEEAGAFHRNRIKGVYCCGFGELFGLEGPTYFLWNRLVAEPSLDPGQLLNTYFRHAFGPAADTMEQFYRLLDERLALAIPASMSKMDHVVADVSDYRLLDSGRPLTQRNLQILSIRYPQAVLTELEQRLVRAEQQTAASKNPTTAFLMKEVRREFDYLKLTAGTVNAYRRFRDSLSDADGKALLEAVTVRTAFINRLPVQPKSNPPVVASAGSFRIFGSPKIQEVRDNGRLEAPLPAPVNWDAQWLLEQQVKIAGRTIATDNRPQLLVQRSFYAMEPEIREKPVTVSCRRDADNLYVTFRFANTTPEAVQNDEIQLLISDGKERLFLSARVKSKSFNIWPREKTNAENRGQGDTYPKIRQSTGKITAPAPGMTEPSAEFTVPFSIFSKAPQSGDSLDFNVLYCSNGKKRVAYIWEYNLDQQGWRNMKDQCGKLVIN